jgi:hypothetical protein
MRHNAPEDFLTPSEKNDITSAVTYLLGDASVAASLVYEQFEGSSFSATTQVVTETWTRTACNGVRGNYSYEEMTAGGGRIDADDIFFLIPQSAVEPPQTKEDRILEFTYDTGALNLTSGSSSVTRYNSSANWDEIQSGDVLKISTSYFDIKETAEATLTLLSSYTSSTATNQEYEIFRRWRVFGIQQDTLKIIWKFQCRSL